MKYLRILYVWPVINIATIFCFAYRYIWFGIETIPSERIVFIMFLSATSCLLFPILENTINK